MVTTEVKELNTSELQASDIELCEFEGQLSQIILLEDIRWSTYKAMLEEMGDHRSVRVAYDQGVLTLKMPSKLHEAINWLLARIALALTEELDLEVISTGSTTLDRDELEKGAEPDSSFYIGNAAKLDGLDAEIPTDATPDLVIEVDITSPSIKRMPIYEALSVPEIWLYTKQKGVSIYHLKVDSYVEFERSLAFPILETAKLNEFLAQRKTESENAVIRAVRKWANSVTES